MRNRCNGELNPKNEAWRGRGIRVCERWESFENFLADMGERPTIKHSLDRIDNDGNYEPGNCRWATRKEQALNRRSTDWIDYKGETLCLLDWARRTGIPARVIWSRIYEFGWPLEQAFTLPPSKRKRSARTDLVAA